MNMIIQGILLGGEIEGSRSSDRFQFQADVSLLKILERHRTKQNYRVIFDYIDDLAFVDDSDDPDDIKTYQIKGWDGKACCVSVMAKKDGKVAPRSIVGKMYKNVVIFSGKITETGLITNAPLKIKLKSGGVCGAGVRSLRGSQISNEEWKKLEKAISDDHPGASTQSYRNIFLIERSEIGIQGHREAIYTIIRREMEKRGAIPDVSPIIAASHLLIESVESKINVGEKPSDYIALCARKSLCRSDIENILQKPAQETNFHGSWPIVERELVGKGIDGTDLLRIKNACLNYISLRATGDAAVSEFARMARDIAKKNKEAVKNAKKILSVVDLLGSITLGGVHASESEWCDFGAKIVEAYEAAG
ncbi:dsDNA nuclease domain-containing protein [Azospirillum sp.]|uniref:dsDNA nuclease domain-containing protein n=1 Tax=Azospirillum sp. TaxID=34012 RepID=UPI002D53FA3E|nr:dsDNA nuclease domain-containing protein [Azospirillum sp.]HYD71448.1 dsDNA nuclease domain-containing protein [Azospirillum sp.]